MSAKDQSKTLADQLFPDRKDAADQFEILDIPPEQRRLHTETYDFTVGTIFEYLQKKDIYIPKFQRSYVWSLSQASRLIESLVIQCPIPVIYLNQEKDEKLSVIDGNQRLRSIQYYLENKFSLRGLTTYPELEGFFFNGLDPRIQRHILNRTLRCIAILKDTHPQIKFDVFERLNTGAVLLTPQELRHGIYHGPLIEMVDKLTDEPVWHRLYGIMTDRRMKGAELILRFLALRNNYENYQKPLSSFINSFCDRYKNADNNALLNWKTQFLTCIAQVQDTLGDLAFRTLDEAGHINKNFNAALYDAQMVGISLFKGKIRKIKKTELMTKLTKLCNEQEFKEAITAGTSATNLMKYRIKRFTEFLGTMERS
ncbi:MAG: DUF262 domain-containing protein [Deltaproteobacteria bacterium]|nr:DUF262 domain-containing protein [Deltaproteobacteria bacterium]